MNVVRDYQDKRGNFFVKNGEYKVQTEFYCAGVVLVNYRYIITRMSDSKVVLSGTNFNPSIHGKTGDEWPKKLGWRGFGELLNGVCDLPHKPTMDWRANRTESEIDWLIEDDASYLKLLGEDIVKSCINLTFQV